MLTIALPKGRIAKQTLQLFEKIFYKEFRFESRKLILEVDGFRFLYVKNQDVPTYVVRGVADIGINGLDVLKEKDYNVVYLMDLGFGKCDIVVGMQKGKKLDKAVPQIKIATKLENIAKKMETLKNQAMVIS